MLLFKALLAFRPKKMDLIFAIKTFAAGILALYVAFELNLSYPIWAIGTVFVIANPYSAQLNLNRSEVLAPADGTLSNFELQEGNYVKVGQAVAALLDREKLYVVGYFEETKLNKIFVGAPASIQLMGDSQVIKGHVQGIASGIEDRERTSTTGLLANVNPTFSWVRLAQRVPVKITLDELPKNQLAFVAGRTVTVHINELEK